MKPLNTRGSGSPSAPCAPNPYAILALALLALSACGGRLVRSDVEGVPVCPDFELGASRTKMRGSLRQPVTVLILEDGKMISRATLFGLRKASDGPSQVLIPNDNGEYEVQWGQCENARAPQPDTGAPVSEKEAAHYECGKAEVYKTDKLVTRKDDPASRKLTFVPPPKPECWMSEVPPSDAEAPDAGPDVAAGANAEDAGAEDAAAGSAEGGAEKASAPKQP